MTINDLKQRIDRSHASGRRVAVSFCSLVPVEVLEAAGFDYIRIHHFNDNETDLFPAGLPVNTCPAVRECYTVLMSGALADADMIITESTCDGKKKMYELLPHSDKYYYLQVPQGVDREYSKPLVISEIRYLMREIEKRFGIRIGDEALIEAASLINRERESFLEVMELTKTDPLPVSGVAMYEAVLANRLLPSAEDRIDSNKAYTEAVMSRPSVRPAGRSRVIISGSPVSAVYGKIAGPVEAEGYDVVCFENCEAMRGTDTFVDLSSDDIIDAIAESYIHSTCAAMSPNVHRFDLIRRITEEWKADALIDVSLSACHLYSVETDKVRQLCAQLGISYLPVETTYDPADAERLRTRIAAMLELMEL